MVDGTEALTGELGVMAADSLACLQLRPRTVQASEADPILFALAGQEPTGLNVGDLDEAEEDQAADGHSGFATGPGSGGEL
jgi:hypothetical protein